ncbi:helix-turn-helix domain-containing protein [Microbacterium aurantiacum]|uniref:helix-turn-helix domain-containing protein n=1 Tax=Microbacterium aurantiacum TaxID=162393 RepID=UPI000C80853B|nr:helix-turn-helix domain-containing protein [Microbacterium aurantiacum]
MIKTLENNRVETDEIQRLLTAVKELPATSQLRGIVADLLDALNRGADIAVVEQDKELSPNEVASLLQVSHPHVLKLIRSGLLFARRNGSHHRVSYEDFIDYVERRDRAARDVADAVQRASKRPGPEITDEDLKALNEF